MLLLFNESENQECAQMVVSNLGEIYEPSLSIG